MEQIHFSKSAQLVPWKRSQFCGHHRVRQAYRNQSCKISLPRYRHAGNFSLPQVFSWYLACLAGSMPVFLIFHQKNYQHMIQTLDTKRLLNCNNSNLSHCKIHFVVEVPLLRVIVHMNLSTSQLCFGSNMYVICNVKNICQV